MKMNVVYLHRQRTEIAEISDQGLLTACAEGDSKAMSGLFDRYCNDIYRFAGRMVGCDRGDLDDIVQNTFIQVQRSAGKYDGRAKVQTWIFGICTNVIRHHIRSEVRRKKLLTAFKRHSIPPHPENTQDKMEKRDQLRKLAKAITRLPFKQRTVFVMCELEGVAGVEASKILNIPQGTLWRRLHEARKTLVASVEKRRP